MRFPEMFVDELWPFYGSLAESEDMSCGVDTTLFLW